MAVVNRPTPASVPTKAEIAAAALSMGYIDVLSYPIDVATRSVVVEAILYGREVDAVLAMNP